MLPIQNTFPHILFASICNQFHSPVECRHCTSSMIHQTRMMILIVTNCTTVKNETLATSLYMGWQPIPNLRWFSLGTGKFQFRHTFLPIKTTSHYKMLHRTKFPVLLPSNIKLSHEMRPDDWPVHATPTTSIISYHKINRFIRKTLVVMESYSLKTSHKSCSTHIFSLKVFL